MKWPSTCLQWYLLLWNLFSLLLIQPLHLLMLTVCMEYILPSLLVIYVFIFKACALLTTSNWVLDFKSSFSNLCLLIGILVYFHLIIDIVCTWSSLLRLAFCLLFLFFSVLLLLSYFCFYQIFLLFHFHFFLGILALYFCTFKSCCSRDYICILNLD